MMTIGSATSTSSNVQVGVGRNMPSDSVSKGIQKQIENAQKRLQELSSNEDMPLEEKMKKRQEIQKEITDLNQQMRQHQIEMRKKQQTQGDSMDEKLGSGKKQGVSKAGGKGSGISQAGMKAMISADVSMKQAQVQGSIATQMEDRASVLESEIKQDKALGANVEKKEEELTDVKQVAQQAVTGQVSALAEANQAMKDAGQAEPGGKHEEEAKDVKTQEASTDGTAEKTDAGKEGETQGQRVDIRL